MAVQLNETNNGKILEVLASGKLTADDYQHFVPEFERLIQQHGKISLLFVHGFPLGREAWQKQGEAFRVYYMIRSVRGADEWRHAHVLGTGLAFSL